MTYCIRDIPLVCSLSHIQNSTDFDQRSDF